MVEARALGFRGLDPCVHCGFCLPACPTYLALGDENDSPRGRIVLMRALERGELSPTDPSLRQHLDACLGCRGCEPACPSGVDYGQGLEAARGILARANGHSLLQRLALAVFARPARWRTLFGIARLLREVGLARALSGPGRMGFAMGMVAATKADRRTDGQTGSTDSPRRRFAASPPRGTVALFRGCVMDVLFTHVHHATRRTLKANGYQVIEVTGQTCCGATHAHAGDRETARDLATTNVRALANQADWIVVNSAGCGALLKDYGHLVGTEEATEVAAKVRDVSELLADAGPRPGGPLPVQVAYDPPCHLQHAQHLQSEPLALLGGIPGLRVLSLPGADRCCGGAGIYGLVHPEVAGMVLSDKIAGIRDAVPRPDIVATGNPGCLMQIGAGLRAAGLRVLVVHPVELLDWSYAAAGFYPEAA